MSGITRLEGKYDSKYESEYKYRMQELIEYILQQPYGSTITLEKASYILKYNLDDEKEKQKFKSQMGRIKNILIDYGYVLRSIVGVGYYILKPKQISGYCYRTYINRSQRILDKSERVLNHVDTTELNETRKEELDNMKKLNENLIETIEGTIYKSPYYTRKEYYEALQDD